MVGAALACSVLFVSAGCIWLMLRFAHRIPVTDIPNERSSHTRPTLRTGGVAIVLSFGLGLCVALWMGLAGRGMLQAVLLPGILVFFLGLADDAFRLGEAIKLALQVLIAVGTVLLGGVVLRSIDVPGLGEVGLGALAVPLTIVWVVGMVNVYNFMDGLDGLVGGVGVIASGWLLLLFSLHGAPELGLVSLLLGTGIAGFLLFNFPPAKIFMGDSGSSFAGFLFAILAIIGAQAPSPGIPFPVFLLLFGAFLADTSVTLVRRMMRGEPWYKAHRSHFYQRVTNLGFSHRDVSVIEYVLAFIQGLLGVAYLWLDSAGRVAVLAFWAVALGLLILAVHRREAQARLAVQG